MAVLAVLSDQSVARPQHNLRRFFTAALGLLLLACVTLCVHGYHPHSDDAALYVAGIKHLCNPALYSGIDVPYLTVQAGASIFEPMMAVLIRASGGRVDDTLFAAYIVTVAFFLVAIFRLTRLLFPAKLSAVSASLLAAASFTLPVAGTSLSIMDPYLTARSFSTPISIFAIEALLSGAISRSALLTLLTCLFHPLMGCCLVLFEVAIFIFLRITQPKRNLYLLAFAGAVAVLFASADIDAYFSPVSQTYRAVVWTRQYLFIDEWKSYEYLGLVAPIVMAAYARNRYRNSPEIQAILSAIVFSGCTIALLCLVFVEPMNSLLLARLQMLRIFQPIYLAGVVLLGGWLGSVYARGHHAVFLFHVTIAASLFSAQLFTYQGNSHLEVPNKSETGNWHQAFVWISQNTPSNAVFASDPHMIEGIREDREGFRATAERSILADDKDGGVATLSPSLAAVWTTQYRAQTDLAFESDAARVANLAPFGVTWLLLPENSKTEFRCPFRNNAVKVCRL